MARAQLKEFDWIEELHQTMVKSLTTTFGLDFLLLEDKVGGDVDTIHNVRQGIYATEVEKNSYINREEYNSTSYHKDKKYQEKGRIDKIIQQEGKLLDKYRNRNMKVNESRQTDHIVSAYEIHNDPGRILAGVDGVYLASMDTNLTSTVAYINNIKDKDSIEAFINEIPRYIENKKKSIERNQSKLANMPENTPEERDKKRKLLDKIRKESEHLELLERFDKEAALAADKKAREVNDKIINKTYYGSSKFFVRTCTASLSQGLRIGTRQALGLVLAEVWFELKDNLKELFDKIKQFDLEEFLNQVSTVFQNVCKRVSLRFKELLSSFGDGFIGGIFSSISTTILNIFLTTQKMIGKLIREGWQSLAQAAKLVFFNPNNLSATELCREVLRLLGIGISVAVGVILNQYLATIFTFPFGAEIAAFVSAFVSGLLTVGLSYFLDHSVLMKKVWNFLDSFKSKYERLLDYYQEINEELDRYLVELSKIEFNMNVAELQIFTESLALANDEYQRGLVLHAEIERRNIELPYESGNIESVRGWLSSLGGSKK